MTEKKLTPHIPLPKEWERIAERPVDLSLDALRGAIEYSVGQPVALGIPYGNIDYIDEDITRAVHGDTGLLAFGEKSKDAVWKLSLGSKKLEKLTPSHVYAQGYIDNREKYTGLDKRLQSRILFSEAEIKPEGGFTRNALANIFNIPSQEIMSSGIDLADVSYSQANRVIEAMRDQYAQGNWRRTLQLALAVPHINNFISYAREDNRDDLDNNIVTIADSHIGQELKDEFRSDVDLLMARALKKGIKELRTAGKKNAADHAEAWLTMHEENLSLDNFPPEVTIDDILKYPSFLNPRPDKGIPVVGGASYLVGGTGSRNYTIKYPDGSIYAVDYPSRSEGSRPIRGNEENGYHGNINEGKVSGFVHTDSEWFDFEEITKRNVAGDLVREALDSGSSFKQDTKQYAEILRITNNFIDDRQIRLNSKQLSNLKNQIAAFLMTAECVKRTFGTIGSASSLFNYSISGFFNKESVEKDTGISLTIGHESLLSEEAKKAYLDFGKSLKGYEVALLAEKYAKHPEFSEHISQYRNDRELNENTQHYYDQMIRSVNRLIGKDETGKLAWEILEKQNYTEASSGNKKFLK